MWSDLSGVCVCVCACVRARARACVRACVRVSDKRWRHTPELEYKSAYTSGAIRCTGNQLTHCARSWAFARVIMCLKKTSEDDLDNIQPNWQKMHELVSQFLG